MVTSYQIQQGNVRSGPMTLQRSKLHNLSLPPSFPFGKSLPSFSGDTEDTIKTRYSSSKSKSEGKKKAFEKARSPGVRLVDSGWKFSPGDEDYGGLNAFREQLMSDLRCEIKLEFMKQRWNPVSAMQLDAGLLVPWNLRSNREVTVVDHEKKENKSMRGIERFSIFASKNEIEQDFIAMIGHRPPQRPKKRKKILQKELNGLFPGTGLTHVTFGKYKVTRQV